MALIKDKTTPGGAVANYWAIQAARYDRLRRTCQIELGGWLSEAAKKQSGFSPLEVQTVQLAGENYPSETPANQIAELYIKITVSNLQTVEISDPVTGEGSSELRETNWWSDAQGDQ